MHTLSLQPFLHGPNCYCCQGVIDGDTQAVSWHMGALPEYNQSLGQFGFLDQLVRSVFDVARVVFETVIKIVKETIKIIKIVVATVINSLGLKSMLESLSKFVGNFLVDVNPIRIASDFLAEFPLSKDIYSELDKFSGGALTTIENLSTITGRALRGDAISKAELIANALFCFRVGVVMMAGPVGSNAFNAATVSGVAGQLKTGTLGKTAMGRDLLGFMEVAGLAYVAGEKLSDVVFNQVMGEAQGQLLTNTPLGKGDLGPIIAGLAMTSTKTAYYGGDQWGAATSFATDYSKKEAIADVANRVGGPHKKEIAKAIVGAASDGSFNPENIFYSSIPNGYSFSQLLEDTSKIYGNVADSLKKFINSQGGEAAFPNIDFSGFGNEIIKGATNVAKEISKIPMNLLDEVRRIPGNLSNVSYPSLSSSKFPGLSIPDVASPDFNFNVDIDWEKMYDVMVYLGKAALYRRQNVRGDGGLYTIYVLEDGSIYYLLQKSNLALYALLGAAGLLMVSSI